MKAILVAGLGFGDESKGATVDKICRELPVDLIVRYNGGSQCAHNVVTPEGVHHTFSQFGSGMLANDKVRTHLSRFMLVDPLCMINEERALAGKTVSPFGRTTVDPRCVIITPFHKRLNRLREISRGTARHGSCGMGIGVARELHLKYGDEVVLAKDLKPSRQFLLHMLTNTAMFLLPEIMELSGKSISFGEVREECRKLVDTYMEWDVMLRMDEHVLSEAKCMVFEGAQGVLLDEKHGTAPHNTWTNTTFENADTLLNEVGVKERFRIGCLRTYHTRHGAGPFPTEDTSLDLPEDHNGKNEFQGAFRVGDMDWKLAADAIDIVGGVDGLAISHFDCLPRLGLTEEEFMDVMQEFKAPVVMKSNGPTAAQRTLELGVYA